MLLSNLLPRSVAIAAVAAGLVAASSLSAGRAQADDGIPPMPVAMDPASAMNPQAVVSGAGIKIGEGTVFHPQIGIETGVVSNVFYSHESPIAAGLLRLLLEVGTSSLPRQRLMIKTAAEGEDTDATPQRLTSTSSGDFQYSADLYATYDQYLSTNDNVTSQGGLGGGLLLRGIVNAQSPLQFAFQEHFSRLVRATNFESAEDTNRDINDLGLRLNYRPTGRSLGGYLYYHNTIDVFEQNSQQFANRIQNLVGLRVNWQWLPLTGVYVDVSQGYYTGLGSSDKVTSYPFTVLGGIQTAFTYRTTLNANVGYTNGFYDAGPSYSSLTASALFGYRYSPLGRITAGYAYLHQDSINANFYRDHLIQLSLEQFVVPFVIYAQPEIRVRQYQGTIVMGSTGTTRDDLIIGATAGIRYNFRDWIAATLDYQLQRIQTDFTYDAGNGMIDPSFTRHELLVGIRAAY